MPLPWWDERTLNAIRRIESGGNDYTTTGSNRGPFQMGPREWSRYGGGGDVFNRSDATAAARRKFADDASAYRRDFGDDPTGDKLYLYHQQGRAGGREHLRNPEGLAWQNVRKFYPSDDVAKKAIWGNVPTDVRSQYQGGVEGLTSGQFADMWRNKFARFAGAPSGGQPQELPQAPLGAGAPAIAANSFGTPAGWQGEQIAQSASAAPSGGLMDILKGLIASPAAAAGAPPADVGDYGPPVAAPDFGQGAGRFAQPSLVPPPNMALGPEGTQPPEPSSFPPLHDPSAFGGGQLPEVPGIATTPQTPRLPGITSSIPPATDTGTAPPPPGLGPNQLPPGWGPQGAPPGVERRGPVGGGGMAPQQGGGGLYDYIAGGAQGGFGGLLQSLNAGLGSRGVSMALPLAFGQAGAQSAAAGQGAHELAIREALAGREQTKFGQEQEAYQQRRRAWEGAFPGGQPNPNHPLLKGLPPGIPEVIQGMGQEDGIKALGTFQMADASKRADLVREMERMRLIQQEAEGIGGQQPTGGAPAPAPAAPAPMGSFAGAGIGGAMPGVDYTPPPALAPQITSPGAPARAPAAGRGPAGVDVMDPETARMQRQAEVFDRWKMRSEPLEKEIERRRKPQVEYATKRAAQQAEQEENKPQARLATTGLIDKLNSTEALTTKLHDDPNLWWTTGNLSSKDSEGNKRPMSSFRFSAESRATEADMNTLVAKVGLDTLREMREGAKTGASGLGGTSDTEINMLSNALTALKDPSISTEAYQQNLRLVREVVGNVRERMMEHWREKYGEEFKPTAPFATYPTKSAAAERKGTTSEPQTGPPASLKGMEKKDADAAYAKIPKGHQYYDPMGRLKRKVE